MKGGLNMLLLARLAGKQKPHDGFVRGSKDAEQGRDVRTTVCEENSRDDDEGGVVLCIMKDICYCCADTTPPYTYKTKPE